MTADRWEQGRHGNLPFRGARAGGVGWEFTTALLIVALLVAGAATLFVTELWLADRVVPGLYVWDVDLGGLTQTQAAERLATTFQYPADRYPGLRHGEQRWEVRPGDLGAGLDVAATVEEAMAVGHSGSLPAQLGEQLDVLIRGRTMLPRFAAQPGAGATLLSGIGRQVNRALRNASLVVGEDFTVSVLPGQDGLEVNEQATRLAYLERLGQMAGGEVELVVRTTPAPLVDVASAQARVEQILSASVSLTAPGFEPWTLGPGTLASWLVLRPAADPGADRGATLVASLDPGPAAEFVAEIASQVARSPVEAKFRFDDGQGQLVPIVESAPGQRLDEEAALALLEAAALGTERTLPLPLVSIPPALATEEGPSLGIVELIAEGKTSFGGSASARVQNIAVGAAQFDGLLIAPGETFSFNQHLGEVTAEKGYEESIIIWGNTTKADVGGGLCQVSSTAFRAAFWAGVPIIERTAHAFRVSYYEPPKGMDATIYSPSVDLKWVNDTGHHILIETYVDRANSTLTFRFYGTKPGRTVEMEGPVESNPVPHGPPVYRDDPTLPKGQEKQIEWAKDGLDVTVVRVIKKDGVEVERDTFFSRYRPWQAVFLVGTKEE